MTRFRRQRNVADATRSARRAFLHWGSLAGLAGAVSSERSPVRAATGNATGAHRARHDTSVILLYLHGGPSHLETYDLKPHAPSEYRSVFRSIPTKVVGLHVCEHLPRHAEVSDRFALVRSLHHDVNIHSDGGIVVLTGKRPTKLDPTSQSKSEHPDFGSVASALRGGALDADSTVRSMPPYVAIPRHTYMTRPTYLGAKHGAFDLGDPSAANFAPPCLTLPADAVQSLVDDRRDLLQRLDAWRRDSDASGAMAAADQFQQQAFQMLMHPETAQAFELHREPDSLRDRYGRHLWGQGCLLARRLAEAGTAVISLYIDTPRSGPEYTNWDDHILNAGRPGHFANFLRLRLQYFDQALATLVEDIHQRGLEQRVLVVAMGEFGRTPRLSHSAQGVGRDHWPQAYSVLFSGGGLRMGQVIGATNAKGEYPTERPYTPQDVLATIYRHLDIDPETMFRDYAGRPVPLLPSGRPIDELV